MNDDKMMNDRFDDFLRQQLQTDYIDDKGFTAQLMAAMPAQRRLNPWLEKLIIALPVALITLLVLNHFPWRDVVQPAYAWFLMLNSTSLGSIVLAVFMLLIVAPVAWLLNSD
jgi:hypothetical protein